MHKRAGYRYEDPMRPQEAWPCADFHTKLTAVCRHDNGTGRSQASLGLPGVPF
jgi:hypothetical protein